MFSNWAIDCFSLFFRKKIWLDCTFDDKFFDNLNDVLIISLNDSLFLDDVFEVINLIDWNVLDVSLRFSLVDEDLNCSYFFLRSFSHSAKFVTSRVTVRITVLKNFWFNAQSMKARFFSLICLKNRIMSRKSWRLAEDSLIIAEKFRLLSTNSRRRCVCRMMWSLRSECFEIRFVNREILTQNRWS
jgi:hypothetical protein